jgi:hypothetical protein
MKNSDIAGSLVVNGNSTLKGLLTSLQKVELGAKNNVILSIKDDGDLEVNGNIKLGKPYKIKVRDRYLRVFIRQGYPTIINWRFIDTWKWRQKHYRYTAMEYPYYLCWRPQSNR